MKINVIKTPLYDTDVVVVIRKDRLQYIIDAMNRLVRDMEAHTHDVPYTFLYNEFLDVSNRVRSVLYEHTVKFDDDMAAAIDCVRTIISYDDFVNFHHAFSPVIGWAALEVDQKRDLPHERIEVWTKYVKQAVEILEQYAD